MNVPTLQQVNNELARRHLADFVEVTSTLVMEYWQRLICSRLDRLVYETGQKILIHAPPQFGKSIITSQRLPAWILGKRPDLRIRLGCYNETHATGFSKINRDLMISEAYRDIFPDPACRVGEQTSAIRWSTAQRLQAMDAQPSMAALGLGSGFTGLGADLLLIDDPYKNRQEAYSTVIREGIWQWWQQVASIRINEASNVVVTFHRWHEDDLAGRLIAQGGWEVLRFPAIADGGADDPSGRAKGESLSPRYSLSFLNDIREKDEAGFAALFQGKPVQDGGNILKGHWWRFWYPADQPAPPPVQVMMRDGSVYECEQAPLPEAFDQQLQSWDTNFYATATSDYTVGQVWGRREGAKYLLDQVKEHSDAPKTVELLRSLSSKWPGALAKYIEYKASGPEIIRQIRGSIEGLIPVTPQGDKVQRVHAVAPTIQAGDVYLPHPTLHPWVTGFIGECSAFPAGAHDDQVDALTQALSKMIAVPWQGEEGETLTAEERFQRNLRNLGVTSDEDDVNTGW